MCNLTKGLYGSDGRVTQAEADEAEYDQGRNRDEEKTKRAGPATGAPPVRGHDRGPCSHCCPGRYFHRDYLAVDAEGNLDNWKKTADSQGPADKNSTNPQ